MSMVLCDKCNSLDRCGKVRFKARTMTAKSNLKPKIEFDLRIPKSVNRKLVTITEATSLAPLRYSAMYRICCLSKVPIGGKVLRIISSIVYFDGNCQIVQVPQVYIQSQPSVSSI